MKPEKVEYEWNFKDCFRDWWKVRATFRCEITDTKFNDTLWDITIQNDHGVVVYTCNITVQDGDFPKLLPILREWAHHTLTVAMDGILSS